MEPEPQLRYAFSIHVDFDPRPRLKFGPLSVGGIAVLSVWPGVRLPDPASKARFFPTVEAITPRSATTG